jgi:hypothetical protein
MTIPRFNAEASLHTRPRSYQLERALFSADTEGRVVPALIGRWDFGTRCHLICIEACTRFCRPTGWDCCEWQTRCAFVCDGVTGFEIHVG